MKCPCGSTNEFNTCCEPFLKGEKNADTAEKLMRSRYVAYVTVNIDYLETTLAPESRSDFDAKSTKQWAKLAKWKGLKIISTEAGTAKDKTGTVEFIATYQQGNETLDHHETSQFRKEDSKWYFIEGDAHTHKEGEDHHHQHEKVQTVVRDQPKVGRNDPCTCGSQKKYKKCCGEAA
jgi:SEC-C motif domain protein